MNVTGKYLKVWKIEEQNGMKKIDLGDSEKNQDGSYRNWTWFGALLVGNAKNVHINQGDKVEVKSGKISQKEYNGKWYTNVVIFDIEVMAQSNGQNATTGHQQAPQASQAQAVADVFGDDSQIPF